MFLVFFAFSAPWRLGGFCPAVGCWRLGFPARPQSRVANEFFNAATPAEKGLRGGVPIGKCRHFAMRRAGWRSLLVMLAFGIFGAAMFAEPAVAEIEKVIGLIQVKRASVGCRVV